MLAHGLQRLKLWQWHICFIQIYTHLMNLVSGINSRQGMLRSAETSDMGIYLYHRHRVHCDVVLSVHELLAQKLDTEEVQEDCSEMPNVCRKQGTDPSDVVSEQRSQSVKCCKSKRNKRVNLVKKRQAQKVRIRTVRDVTEKEKRRECEQYKNDIEFRETKKAKCRHYGKMKDRNDETYTNRAQVIDSNKQTSKEKYHTSNNHRLTKVLRSKTKYKENNTFRKEVMNASKEKCKKNFNFRKEVMNSSKEKYKKNVHFRKEVLNASKEKYLSNETFRDKVINVIKFKYKLNPYYKKATMDNTAHRCKVDTIYRNKVITASLSKYHNDINFQKNVIERTKSKYHGCATFRQNVKRMNASQAMLKNVKKHDISNVISNFKKEISNGPEYVCAVCFRLLFRKQVIKCNNNKYKSTDCISVKYLHKCDDNCGLQCAQSSRSCLWIIIIIIIIIFYIAMYTTSHNALQIEV